MTNNFPGASHLPILAKLMNHSRGDVLELGMGYYSTPFLYWMCKVQGRNLYSYENDQEWIKKLDMKQDDTHTYFTIDDWEKQSYLYANNASQYAIAFIDHRPALRRHKDAIFLKQLADYVVLHDSESEIDKFYAYRRIWPHYKYRYDFDEFLPNTTVVSNFYPLDFLKD